VNGMQRYGLDAKTRYLWYHYSMITVSVNEIQNDPLGYIQKVLAGETVVVLKGGRPVVEIKPVAKEEDSKQKRPFGLCAGEFHVPADFDEPLPEEILNRFEGK
jgi:antitoxin (DNA-binding transcriptional repressor) of toxin-antitoxin stability system